MSQGNLSSDKSFHHTSGNTLPPQTDSKLEFLNASAGFNRQTFRDADMSMPYANKPARFLASQIIIKKIWHDSVSPLIEMHPETAGLIRYESGSIIPGDKASISDRCAAAKNPSDALLLESQKTTEFGTRSFAKQFSPLTPKDQRPTLSAEEAQSIKFLKQGERACGYGEFDLDKQWYDSINSGFLTALWVTWGCIGALPAVGEAHLGRPLREEELKNLFRDSRQLMGQIALSHLSVLSSIMKTFNPNKADLSSIGENSLMPFDADSLTLSQRGGRLVLDLSESAVSNIECLNQTLSKSANDPRLGCPAAPVIAEFHEWCCKVADEFLVPELIRRSIIISAAN